MDLNILGWWFQLNNLLLLLAGWIVIFDIYQNWIPIGRVRTKYYAEHLWLDLGLVRTLGFKREKLFVMPHLKVTSIDELYKNDPISILYIKARVETNMVSNFSWNSHFLYLLWEFFIQCKISWNGGMISWLKFQNNCSKLNMIFLNFFLNWYAQQINKQKTIWYENITTCSYKRAETRL